jgi:mono/diheme cytochrome c family protein
MYRLLVSIAISVGLVSAGLSRVASAVEPTLALEDQYQPTLFDDPPVPAPPESAVEDFQVFLQRLAAASERAVEALIFDEHALPNAEQILLDSVGVPGDLPLERHRPFLMVNPEAIFALYADLPTLERGFALYQQNCSQCHGVYGRGNGTATDQWYVGNLPRNFTYAKYKSRSTDYGSTPTDSDVFRTLTRGLYGSSMPSFRHLSQSDRWSLVQFLKSLGNYYDDYEEVVVNRFDPAVDEGGVALDLSGQTPISQASVDRGRALFVKHACVSCHQGSSDKPVGLSRSAGTFSNWADEMNRPIHSSRDLTTPVFLAGAAATDLFRIIIGGPNIGPMPNYQTLPTADAWALVHYLQSCFDPELPQAESVPLLDDAN